jgi:hypothetical protein
MTPKALRVLSQDAVSTVRSHESMKSGKHSLGLWLNLDA